MTGRPAAASITTRASAAATIAAGVLALCAGCASMRPARAPLLEHDDHRASVSALVIDLRTGERLLERDPARLLRPASTMKLLTTAALCRRAPDAALVTRLVASDARDGIVTLLAAGDPFLSSAELGALASELRSVGVESCAEVVVVDPLLGAPRFGMGWMWDDEPEPFQPALSAATVDGGTVSVVATGTAERLSARLSPVAGDLTLRVAPGPGPLTVTRGRYRDADLVTVGGSLGAGETVERRISVPDPASYTGAVLVDALERAGIAVADRAAVVRAASAPGAPTSHAVELARPVAEVIVRTNKSSDNLGAELVLRHVGAQDVGAQDPGAQDAGSQDAGPLDAGSLDAGFLDAGERDTRELGAGAADAGLAVLRADVRALGLDPDGYRLADGSGVSHYTLVSAELLVATLADLRRRGGAGAALLERSLPVAGVDGTLARRMRGTPAERRVRAKTGTLTGVSALAGYVTTASGRELAFAILVQDFVGPAGPWRALADELCVRLAEL